MYTHYSRVVFLEHAGPAIYNVNLQFMKELLNNTIFLTMPSPTNQLALPNGPTSPSHACLSYKIIVGNEISDDTLKSCADLFSSNYGIWGEQASMISKYTIAGQ